MLLLQGLITTVIGFLFGNGTFIDILNLSSHISRHLSGRVQCSHWATSATWTTMSSGNPIYHGRHLSGRVQCSHQDMFVMWTTMSSCNPIYHERHLSGRVQCSHWVTSDEFSHEIRQPHLWATVWVHITLPSVGELKHLKSTILTTMVWDLEKL